MHSEKPTDIEATVGDPIDLVHPVFAKALSAQGFTELTTVQAAVLDPGLVDRDLRICSQTGSGKTVALGLVVGRSFLDLPTREHEDGPSGPATPKVLLIAPTRDLAAQLGKELAWLFGGLHLGIAILTGGTSISRDLRALSAGPEVIVGTPGRLVDHLDRGSLSLSSLESVVLDEADEMLDMGFRDELESILDRTPEKRITHMVSATFSRRVEELANRYQRDAVMVEGTVGSDHQDISHSAILVNARDRVDALVNLLLLHPDQRILVFVRTRVAATGVAGELSSLGFSVSALSGEMPQRERARCLADFRARRLQCVIATDVASRGLDIRGVQRIVHFDLPDNIEAFTHRSGRTGRAGDKGESVLLVPRNSRRRAEQLFRITKTKAQWRSAPTPSKIRKANRRRLLRRYAPESAGAAADSTKKPQGAPEEAQPDLVKMAEKLLEKRPAVELVADLLADVGLEGPVAPRSIAEIDPHAPDPASKGDRRGRAPGQPPWQNGKSRSGGKKSRSAGYTPFHVSWGARTGATPKRMLAHICRRSGIDGSQVGAIEIHEFRSVVDVNDSVAQSFEKAAARPDPRNPKVYIKRFVPQAERRSPKKGGKKGPKKGFKTKQR